MWIYLLDIAGDISQLNFWHFWNSGGGGGLGEGTEDRILAM